jgi:surface protein
MDAVFQQCSTFEGDVSLWDVSRVTSFLAMFSYCTVFDGDLSTWNTSSAENMKSMFDRANYFSSDISSWEMGRVTNTYLMVRKERHAIELLRHCSQLTIIFCVSLLPHPY